MRKVAPTLAIEKLTVTYGGVVAVSEFDLEVPASAIVGLIGPNGAGKTSLIDAVAGFTACSGNVTLNARSIDGLPPHERSQAGLVRTFQSVELFDDLDVRANLEVATHRPQALAFWRDIVWPGAGARREVVNNALDLLGIETLADSMPRELSQGQRQLVGIARAIATSAKVLLLDEPAAGLDTVESAQLGGRLRGLLESGIAILLVDHDMGLVLSVCDLVYVINGGRRIAAGAPAAVRADPSVIEAYLGSRHSQEVPG
jgi:branched-chain amino acid transport system ATP-binding protein